MTTLTMERDILTVQLQESERLRTEAFQAYETMRLERDGWKAGAEAGQQQAMELRQQVEALESSLAAVLEANKTLLQQLADADDQIRQFERINDTRDELQHKNKELQAQLSESERLRTAVTLERNHWIAGADHARENVQQLRLQLAELQAQLEAAAVTPTQQPDGNAALRLETVRRMIGEIRGWYACVGRLDEVRWAEVWEQVGALLGDLHREAQ